MPDHPVPRLLISFVHRHRHFLVFVALMVVFRSSFADWNDVPTTSMDPSIRAGDRILVNKMAYDFRLPLVGTRLWRTGEPRRGDIVVFESAAADTRLVKRVIGLPGDTVALVHNRLQINGEPIEYARPAGRSDDDVAVEVLGTVRHPVRRHPRGGHLSSFAAVTVPDDHYLVLGDNRDNSADSRVYGLVPRSELVGRAGAVVFSLDYDNYWLPRGNRFFLALDAEADDA